jgi:hypothetical protein
VALAKQEVDHRSDRRGTAEALAEGPDPLDRGIFPDAQAEVLAGARPDRILEEARDERIGQEQRRVVEAGGDPIHASRARQADPVDVIEERPRRAPRQQGSVAHTATRSPPRRPA